MDAKGAQALRDYIEEKQGRKFMDIDRAEFYRSNEEWRFRIVSANNEIVMWGESYKNKSDAQATVNKFANPNLKWYECNENNEWVEVFH